jgi:hypothetical protein
LEHCNLNLFIRERFVAGSQDTFPVQYLHGVEPSDFEGIRPELIRRQEKHLDSHSATIDIDELTQSLIDRRLEADNR